MSYYTSVNFYDLFEIGPRAGQTDIESAYRRQLDMISGSSLATYGLFVGEDVVAIRQRLEEAYHVLSDPHRRRAYDLKTYEHSFVSPDMESGSADASAQAATGQTQATAWAQATTPPPAASTASTASTAPPEGEPETMPPTPPHKKDPLPALTEFDGATMRAHREAQGLTLEAIAARTKIAQYYLEYIEEERYTSLPPGIYLRSYLQQYAQAIGANSKVMATAYLARRAEVEAG